jgi:transglutaminase-like putative cysteine protease/tetratricopeptide (TPR) repeat protein
MGMGVRSSILPLVAIAVGCLACRAAAQKPSADPDYSKEAVVVETYRTTAAFQNDGKSSRDLTLRVRINSDAGVQQYSVLVFPYASAIEKIHIDYVRVTHPGGAVVETPSSSIQDESAAITRQAPEYSDYREKHVAVKGLGPGDVLEYHVHYQLTSPLVPGQFWFAYDFDTADICLSQELQVSVPEGRAVKVHSTTVQPTVTDQGARRIYLWKTHNLKPKENPRHYRAGRLPAPGVLVSSYGSWAQVGDWWKGLEAPRAAPTPQIVAKAAALTKGLTTEEAKLRAVYSYVALNFHYIGISFGIGRYQPHAAADVLNNQYGDCKDQHTLLASLLRAAGIQAWPALINATQRLDPSVPSPGQFDHVISVVRLGQKLVWMDTTTGVAPLGLLAPPLEDKQALVIPDGPPPYLAETPAIEANDNFVHMDVDAQMGKDGTLTAKMQDSTGGDRGLLMRIAFRSVPEAKWKDLVQGISRLEGYGGTVSDVSASSPEDTDHPFKWTYNYTRKDYPDWKNNRITAPLPPVLLPEASDDKEKADQPVILEALVERRYHATVKLPPGYLPTLPAPVDLIKPYADYHASYTFENGALQVERDLVTKLTEVAAADRNDYRDFRKAVTDDESRYIDLGSSASPASFAAGSEEFQKTIRQAYAEANQHHLRAALETTNQALKLNPNSMYAWEMAAALHMDMRETDQAIAAARKAVKSAPADLRACEMLSRMLRAARMQDEVVPVWRDFVQRNPKDPNGHANLASALMGEKKYLGAIPEIQAASRLDSKQWHYNIMLGDALVQTGNKTAAVSAFEKVVSQSNTPEALNDAGYYMADAGMNLPEAEHWAIQAVQAKEARTSNIALASLSKDDLRQMPLLSAYWDTLGWVYFREGKLVEARKYAAASFALDQRSIVADHMGQIDAKLGHRSAAIREEAVAVSLFWQLGVVRSSPASPKFDPAATGARGRLSHLVKTKAAFASALSKTSDELSASRTFRVSKAGLRPGTADFYVLFSPGATAAEVKFISGTDSLRAAAHRIATLKYYLSFPGKGPAKAVRRGALTCSKAIPTCDFVLYPSDTAPNLMQ